MGRTIRQQRRSRPVILVELTGGKQASLGGVIVPSQRRASSSNSYAPGSEHLSLDLASAQLPLGTILEVHVADGNSYWLHVTRMLCMDGLQSTEVSGVALHDHPDNLPRLNTSGSLLVRLNRKLTVGECLAVEGGRSSSPITRILVLA